ncbi:MAG: hypothetical protein ACJA2E_002269 [Arenicella sp.]|jgi:hypothetical protein
MDHKNAADQNEADTSSIKTSALLAETLNAIDSTHVSIGDLMMQFQRRSFGGVLLILALLAMVPGISVFAGIAMVVPAFQLFMGLPAPVFPNFIQQRQVGVASLQKWGVMISRGVERLETLVVPRWPSLSNRLARRLIGLVILFLGIVVSIPFPFSNFPPALATICFALGLLERDGLMIIIAAILSAIAFTIGFTVFYIIINWVTHFFAI